MEFFVWQPCIHTEDTQISVISIVLFFFFPQTEIAYPMWIDHKYYRNPPATLFNRHVLKSYPIQLVHKIQPLGISLSASYGGPLLTRSHLVSGSFSVLQWRSHGDVCGDGTSVSSEAWVLKKNLSSISPLLTTRGAVLTPGCHNL